MNPVRGCLPLCNLASCPRRPPPSQAPVCFPGHRFARLKALVSAYPPHVEHQRTVPLNIRVCPPPACLPISAMVTALVAQSLAADPGHCCGAITDQVRVHLQQSEHDQRSLWWDRQWPPRAGGRASTRATFLGLGGGLSPFAIKAARREAIESRCG